MAARPPAADDHRPDIIRVTSVSRVGRGAENLPGIALFRRLDEALHDAWNIS